MNFQIIEINNNLGIWKYANHLPNVKNKNRITLGEGNTPLIESEKLANELGIGSLFFKMELMNPTGSYKDRIASLGVSLSLENKKNGLIGTSSGNAGTSFAAYAARAGVSYDLFVLENISEAKLQQLLTYNANVKKVKRFGTSPQVGDKVFNFIIEQGKINNKEVTITAYKFNSEAMEAVRTISYEIIKEFERVGEPDAVFVPVGGGGLYTGIWKGFKEIYKNNKPIPNIVAVQAEGCSNIVTAWRKNLKDIQKIISTTKISGLQVPNPPDGKYVLSALQGGDGWGETATDEEAWKWQELLAEHEGILCEPAAAITLAGIQKAVEAGRLHSQSKAICILTGAGYKDQQRLNNWLKNKRNLPIYEINYLEEI